MLQTPVPPIPPIPPEIPSPPFWMMLDPKVTVTVVLLVAAAATVILWPIMRALGRRIEGRGLADPALREEIDRLSARLTEAEGMQVRLAELEERLDFAERLLAQQRQPERLEPR